MPEQEEFHQYLRRLAMIAIQVLLEQVIYLFDFGEGKRQQNRDETVMKGNTAREDGY